MNRRTKEWDEDIKDLIRSLYMEEPHERQKLFKSWWMIYPYHIKVGIFGLNNLEITVILLPDDRIKC